MGKKTANMHKLLIILLFLALQGFVGAAVATSTATGAASANEVAAPTTGCTLQMPMAGPIGAASVEFFEQGLQQAEKNNCSSVLLLINTPGGLITSTRIIVEKILNSPRPVLCFVWPDGGHAGSAGSIILQACHIAGAMRTTHMGAATPINAMGAEMPEDARNKMLNDTTSWLDSLTGLRGRSQKFGRDIITEAKSVPAEEAYKLGALDFVGDSVEQFLQFARTRQVRMPGGVLQRVGTGPIQNLQPGLRVQLMSFLMNSEVAYLLFTGGMGLLMYEFTHPGLLLPGIVGSMAMIVGAMSLHKMDANLGAMLLLLLGLVLLVAEAFVPSFGVLGLGGVVSFVLGGLFLFDSRSELQLPLSLVLSVSAVFAALALVVIVLAYKGVLGRRVHRKASSFELDGELAIVASLDVGACSGFIELQGESWRFTSTTPCRTGDKVIVRGSDGMVLKVEVK